jgi:hypothetical protein
VPGDAKNLLTLILGVGRLIDETLAHQCRHDAAQRGALDLKRELGRSAIVNKR